MAIGLSTRTLQECFWYNAIHRDVSERLFVATQVAEIAVSDGSGGDCIDSGHMCSVIGKDYMTCDGDFCPGCSHAHECDLTCGYWLVHKQSPPVLTTT